VSNKRTGNTGKSRAKAANSGPGGVSKVVIWVALLAIVLLVVFSVIR